MGRSNQDAISTIALVCLAVIAVALVASTIGSVEGIQIDVGGEREPGEDIGGPVRTPVDDGQQGGNGTAQRSQLIDLKMCVEFLTTGPAVLAILAGMFGLLYLSYRRYNAATAGLFGTFLLPVVMLFYFVMTNCATGGFGEGSGLPSGGDVIGSPGATGLTAPQSPLIIAAVGGGIVLVAAALVVTMSRDEEQFDPVEEEEVPDVDAADFAAAAGRAADRIEEKNVSVDNAVYRAWLEMTGFLHIDNPETAAPRTFAEEAIAVGLDEEDVWKLTELFTEVRYGGRDPDAREDDALETLRNIERTYETDMDETPTDGTNTSAEDDQ